MSSPYDLFETDADLEAGKGVDIPYKGFFITINRAGGSNRKYLKALNEKMEAVRANVAEGTLEDGEATRILAEVYAETVITGWGSYEKKSGKQTKTQIINDRDGKAMTFTVANCVKLLTELPDLFSDIQGKATNFANFRRKQVEADAKNSAKS